MLSESGAVARLSVYDFAREEDRQILIAHRLRAVRNSTVPENQFNSP